MQYSNVLDPLKGLGMTFIVTGLMAIGFMSFGGMDVMALTKEKEVKKSDVKVAEVQQEVKDTVTVVDTINTDTLKIIEEPTTNN